jgi:hypothetical protein
VLTWAKQEATGLEVVVQTRIAEKLYPIDRAAGTMIVAAPAPPYRIGYRMASQDALTVLATAGAFPDAPPTRISRVRVRFHSGVETATLMAPRPPEHLKPVLRSKRVEVDLFIKVNPAGKVSSTSSPYYSDPAQRDLARLTSDTATQQWRFKPVNGGAYRDARVRVFFEANGVRIQPYFD